MTEIRRFALDTAGVLPNPQIHGMRAAVVAIGASLADRVDDPVWVERYQGNPIVLHNEGLIAALHFEAGGAIDEHDAPDDIIFLVIGGSGWVRVGGPQAPAVAVQAGDAVPWPPGVLHTAWTTDSPMTGLAVHYPL